MARTKLSRNRATCFDPAQARWLLGVLGLLIAVVGAESPLGVVLLQARSEIASLLRTSEISAPAEGGDGREHDAP
jgi:hypothetical protein